MKIKINGFENDNIEEIRFTESREGPLSRAWIRLDGKWFVTQSCPQDLLISTEIQPEQISCSPEQLDAKVREEEKRLRYLADGLLDKMSAGDDDLLVSEIHQFLFYLAEGLKDVRRERGSLRCRRCGALAKIARMSRDQEEIIFSALGPRIEDAKLESQSLSEVWLDPISEGCRLACEICGAHTTLAFSEYRNIKDSGS